jgi:FAD:protein FMN transferase
MLKLNDMAVATSGDYHCFEIVENKKLSHIIDTKAVKGAGKLSSDTIIAITGTDAEGLSTTINVLGPEKGLTLIESTPVRSVSSLLTAPTFASSKAKGLTGFYQNECAGKP